MEKCGNNFTQQEQLMSPGHSSVSGCLHGVALLLSLLIKYVWQLCLA